MVTKNHAREWLLKIMQGIVPDNCDKEWLQRIMQGNGYLESGKVCELNCEKFENPAKWYFLLRFTR